MFPECSHTFQLLSFLIKGKEFLFHRSSYFKNPFHKAIFLFLIQLYVRNYLSLFSYLAINHPYESQQRTVASRKDNIREHPSQPKTECATLSGTKTRPTYFIQTTEQEINTKSKSGRREGRKEGRKEGRV
jgi:hypothetical protein